MTLTHRIAPIADRAQLPMARPIPGYAAMFVRTLSALLKSLVTSASDRLDGLRHELESAADADHSCGIVYLVGGGPGNPELLTLRALRVMRRADVVLYDHLVAPAIVDRVRRRAERIYVGKKSGNHVLPQQDINALMVRFARQGKKVVRLKGGDPFVFGRGGEEIETLAAHGIRFEIVPGITAACGAGAFAGIPLTHRDHAHSCVFVTGHLKDGAIDLDWAALARPMQTVVIYMGVHGLAVLAERLAAHGLAPDTPAGLVENATLPSQRVLTGTLATIAELAVREKVMPPALLIVGEVVALRDKLAWYQPDRLEANPT